MQEAKLEQYRKLLAERSYKADFVPEQQFTALTIGGQVIGNLQSFVVFSGIPKSGKSTYMSACLGSAYKQESIFSMQLQTPPDRPIIALFDTESSEYDFYKQVDRVCYFGGVNRCPDTFKAFLCRQDEPSRIINMVTAFLMDTPQCSVVCIDGLLDLLIDFNNVEESKRLINWIKRITKEFNILLISVLHIGKKEGQTLGHLGSMADRLVQSSVKIERNKQTNTFDMTPTFLRSAPDFEPISIQNINGTWFQVNAEPQQQEQSEDPLADIRAINVIVPTDGILYKPLVEDVAEHFAVGQTKAKRIISKWIDKALIAKNHEGKYIRK